MARATPGRARVSHCSKRMTQFRNNAPRRPAGVRANETQTNKRSGGRGENGDGEKAGSFYRRAAVSEYCGRSAI